MEYLFTIGYAIILEMNYKLCKKNDILSVLWVCCQEIGACERILLTHRMALSENVSWQVLVKKVPTQAHIL